MYCVIQEVRRKKPNQQGAYREYEVSSMTIQFSDGSSKTHYSYYPRYAAGRFDRAHRESYKISIHESRRENGKVVKKQCAVGTVGYYDLVHWGLYDYINDGINRAAEMFGADYEDLYRLVENKMQPIIEKIKKEYRKTDEYKAERQREKIEKAHQKAKQQFGKQYDVDPDEYDYCFNVFGELMDKAYFDRIVQQHEQKQEANRRYRESWRSTYERYTGGSYSVPSGSTYSEEERAILKRFYRSLSKVYHPDLNPGVDTEPEMKLLNRLKEAWGV